MEETTSEAWLALGRKRYLYEAQQVRSDCMAAVRCASNDPRQSTARSGRAPARTTRRRTMRAGTEPYVVSQPNSCGLRPAFGCSLTLTSERRRITDRRPRYSDRAAARSAGPDQVFQPNCCALRAEFCDSTMLTRAGPLNFIAASSALRMSFGSWTKAPKPPNASIILS